MERGSDASDVDSEATEGYDVPVADDGHSDLDSEAAIVDAAVQTDVCFKPRSVCVSML